MVGFVDSALLAVAAFRARAGWRRGFVAQALDVAGFGVALVLAYRFWCVLAGPWARLGLSPGWASVAGALTAFVPVIVAVAITGWKLGRITRQPGLNLTNRLLGAALALLLAAVAFAFLESLLPARVLMPRGSTSGAILSAVEPAMHAVGSLVRAVLPAGCAR